MKSVSCFSRLAHLAKTSDANVVSDVNQDSKPEATDDSNKPLSMYYVVTLFLVTYLSIYT